MDRIITRFAPSPTGYLHLGSIRTALINYIISKKAKQKFPNSKFLLRIEDTDKLRSNEKYSENIISGLNWLGIQWDEEIIYQSQRFSRHKEIALSLLKFNLAFKCVCTSEELEFKRKLNEKKNISIKRLCDKCENNKNIQLLENNYCIRIKIPNEPRTLIKDLIQGNVEIKNKELDNFILLRQDNTPTYMLSVVVDDHDMNVNTIIRGNDHFNNAFRHIQIYKHLGWKIPQYAHLPLIHGEDGSKLSKRHGAVDINKLKNIGYLPKAIINNLILLGWSPKKDKEIIDIEEIIKKFEIQNLSKSSSIFDYKKLKYFNNYYIQEVNGFDYLEKFINSEGSTKQYLIKDKDKIKIIFETYKDKIKTLNEFIDIINIYLDEEFVVKNNNILDKNFKILVSLFLTNLQKIEVWKNDELDLCLKTFISEKKIKFSSFGKPLRYILTKNVVGPPIISIFLILGKENTLIRMNKYINS